MAKKKSTKKIQEPEIPPITINADQLAFSNDKEIDDLARYLEERLPPSEGLKEIVRNRNTLNLILTQPISKRRIR
ncbi:MAG: hypothetical protein ACTSRA_05455, partial [Promethearchaeota archaeon]